LALLLLLTAGGCGCTSGTNLGEHLQLPPPPPLPPIPVAALLGNWTHQGDDSIVTVTQQQGQLLVRQQSQQQAEQEGESTSITTHSGGGGNTSIQFATRCKPCCFKSGYGAISADGRHLTVNASSPRCVRLATGRVYEGSDNYKIVWEAHSPEGKKAGWKDWVKTKQTAPSVGALELPSAIKPAASPRPPPPPPPPPAVTMPPFSFGPAFGTHRGSPFRVARFSPRQLTGDVR
jgi:hypothetical protein